MTRTAEEVRNTADSLAKRFEHHKPDPSKVIAGDALADLRAAVTRRAEAESAVEDAIRLARIEGHSWSAIGSMVGTTGEAVRQRHGDSIAVAAVRRLPIRKMRDAGWIDERTSRKDLYPLVGEVLDFTNGKVLAAARRSDAGSPFSPEQLAWLVRARQMAAEQGDVCRFDPSAAEDLARSLVQLSSDDETTAQVPDRLAQVGIRLVVLPQLPGSKIDGAAFFLDDESPVIALTLRYDRVDHFWFTLLHELAHIVAGHVTTNRLLLDDETLSSSDLEEEANTIAAGWAIPGSPESLPKDLSGIVRFARDRGIAPGIIVGRQHHLEELPYQAFRKTLTRVRHLFSADR